MSVLQKKPRKQGSGQRAHLWCYVALNVQNMEAHKLVLLAVCLTAIGDHLRRDVSVGEFHPLGRICQGLHQKSRGTTPARAYLQNSDFLARWQSLQSMGGFLTLMSQ